MVKKKKKRKHTGRNIFLTLFVLLLLASGSYALYHFDLIPQEAFDDDKNKIETLDFCSTKNECLSYLKNNGIPLDYLEVNDIMILCQNGLCVVTKR